MGFFKKKVVKEIHGALWGCMFNVHKIDVATLEREIRCVEKDGIINKETVTLVRVFKPLEAENKGVKITGWETFDQHPELILFEGYLTKHNNIAFLEKRKG